LTRSLPARTARRLARLLADEDLSSFTEVAKVLSISRTTLSKYRRLILESGYSVADFAALNSKQMQEAFEQQAIRNNHPERYIVLMSSLPDIWRRVSKGESNLRICWKTYQSFEECKNAIDKYIADRNMYYLHNPKRAGDKIWGKELVLPSFRPSNNCKDPNWR